MTRIFLCAGESSGDLHGASLIRALREIDPAIACEGLGGRRMEAAGMALRCDLAGKGIMGFAEVLKSLRAMRALLHDTARHLRGHRPDCLVVIDYPGFNIRLAANAHAAGIPVVYYISPQVWAWHRKRIHTIARITNKVLVILPFEQQIYADVGVDCAYVGHPLLDHIAAFKPTGAYAGQYVIGLMPGSREQEIARLLPVMVETARGIRSAYPDARFVVPCVDHDRESQIRQAGVDFPIETAVGESFEVLAAARFCLVASGTATLEAALFGVPMGVLYKVAPLTYWIARRLVRVDHIALVNIIAGKRLAPEFIQNDAKPEDILPAALERIADSPVRQDTLRELQKVREKLGAPGASRRAATEILSVAREGAHG